MNFRMVNSSANGFDETVYTAHLPKVRSGCLLPVLSLVVGCTNRHLKGGSDGAELGGVAQGSRSPAEDATTAAKKNLLEELRQPSAARFVCELKWPVLVEPLFGCLYSSRQRISLSAETAQHLGVGRGVPSGPLCGRNLRTH